MTGPRPNGFPDYGAWEEPSSRTNRPPADGGREEKRVPKHKNAAAADPPDSVVGMPSLPDLTGVGLRSLRGMRDPGLAAAVRSALRRPAELGETWYSSGAGVGKRTGDRAGT